MHISQTHTTQSWPNICFHKPHQIAKCYPHKNMLSQPTFFSCACVKVKKNINGETRTIVSMAKKDDFSQKSTPKTPLKIVSQAVVAVLGLGFIDAGYSGDWSRIGVISKENEDFLKVAALVVVPLCLFIIFSISKTADD